MGSRYEHVTEPEVLGTGCFTEKDHSDVSSQALLNAMHAAQVPNLYVIEYGGKIPWDVWKMSRLPFLIVPYIADFGIEIEAPAGYGNIPLLKTERRPGPTQKAAMKIERFNVFGSLGDKAAGLRLTHTREDPAGRPLTDVGSVLKLVAYQAGIVRRLCPPMVSLCLPHSRSCEVVLLHMCFLCKCSAPLEKLLKLTQQCE